MAAHLDDEDGDLRAWLRREGFIPCIKFDHDTGEPMEEWTLDLTRKDAKE